MQVSAVPTEYVIPVWPQVQPFMEKAATWTHGRYAAEDILDSLLAGERQLWVAFGDDREVKGAVVTGFNVYPKKKYLDLTFIGGDDGFSWKEPMLKMLRHWAYDTQCAGIESSARAGWARIFKADGYKYLWQSFELPVASSGLET
jgi:hypothetical protein